jgi:hypothetical protein
MFGNKVNMEIFATKTDEKNGQYRILHNGGLNYLGTPANIFRVLKSRRALAI